jgi:hypothetical protein
MDEHLWIGSVVLTPGDIVYMNRGNAWIIANPCSTDYMTVGQSGTLGHPITTTAYGTGAKPIINISGNYHYSIIRGNGKSYITPDNLEITHYNSTRSENKQWRVAIMEDGNRCFDFNVP